MLEISSFDFSYGSSDRSFSLHVEGFVVPRGSFVYLQGPSGCGKSTLMNLLGGVIHSGIGGMCRKIFPEIGYIMHESTLLPWSSVRKNLKIEELLRQKSCDRRKFEESLVAFGLSADTGDLFPSQLSLGMRQRVEIAKALAFDVDLLLLDEGFSGIDSENKRSVMETLWQGVRRSNFSVVATTHQITDIMMTGQIVYCFGDGVILKKVQLPGCVQDRLRLESVELAAMAVQEGLLF